MNRMFGKALGALGATLSMLVAAAAPSAAQGSVDWVQPTRGVSIALDAADNVFTVDYEAALGAEMVLTKRTAGGALLWQASYDQLDATKWERASWVTTDSGGNAIICGTSMSGYSNPVQAASIVAKFDANGGLEWRQVYESSFDGSYTKKCLVDANDNVYVLGTGQGPAGYTTKVKKFSPDGVPLWSYFDADGLGAPVNFKLTPDGFLVISQRSVTGSINGYAKIDLQGQKVWSRAGVYSLTVGDAAGDLLGNTYLVHGEYVVSNPRTVVKKVDAAGALIWENFYVLGGFRVEVGNDNRAVVSGFPNSGSAGAAFIKVDEDGDLLWSNLDADGPQMLLMHAHMLLDGSNNAYLAASNLFSMAVCKVNSDGTSGWTATVTGSNASAIAIGDGDRSVFVVGGATARLSNGPAGSAPGAPTGLTSGLLTPTTVELRWTDNASTETGFALERCPGSLAACQANPALFTIRATLGANVTAYTDSALLGGTPYSWRVRAFNAAGPSGYSNTLSVTTPLPTPTLPAAPSGLTSGLLTPTSADLRWTDNASNETGYTLERCPGTLAFCQANSAQFTIRATLGANLTAYTDSALLGGTPYCWRVRAFNATGPSGYSNTLSVTTPLPTLPAAPTNLKAGSQLVGGQARVGLIWTDNATNETGYRVERCKGSTCTAFAAIVSLPMNSVTYTDSAVARATTYRYRVMATGPLGNSKYSNIVRLKTR